MAVRLQYQLIASIQLDLEDVTPRPNKLLCQTYLAILPTANQSSVKMDAEQLASMERAINHALVKQALKFKEKLKSVLGQINKNTPR